MKDSMTDRFALYTTLTNRINRNVYRIKNKGIKEFGIKTAHVPCLYHLLKSGSLTASELCQLCEEDKAIMSRTLDYLEKNEFVTGEKKDSKRYNTPFHLTAKGKDLAENLLKRINLVLNEVSTFVGNEELAIFYKHLTTLDESLEYIAGRLEHIASKL
jgi:DNA-binding MarR family transcriptional regulator